MAKRKQTTALAPKSNEGELKVRAMLDRMSGELTKALGKHLDSDQFARVAMSIYKTADDRFQQADIMTLMGAIMQAAQLNLKIDPHLQEFYLIPRYNGKLGCMVIEGQIGYKGLIKLAARHPNFLYVTSRIVREGDYFEDYDEGKHPVHRKQLDVEEKPKLRCTYATIYYKSGGSQTWISPMYEILDARGRSDQWKKSGGGPWKLHFEGMAKVVPLREILKRAPADDVLGAKIADQLAREDAQSAGEVIEMPSFEELTGLEPEPEAIEAAPSNVQELKPAPQERTDRKPTAKEQAARDTARNAVQKLKDEFGFPDNDTIYKVATGRDSPMPHDPSTVVCFAIAQLAALCELAAEQKKSPPQTHADMYEAGVASERPIDHPLFKDGELTANGKAMAAR